MCSLPGDSLPNMPQLDAAHDQGRKVAPSMRHQSPDLNSQARGNREKRVTNGSACLSTKFVTTMAVSGWAMTGPPAPLNDVSQGGH